MLAHCFVPSYRRPRSMLHNMLNAMLYTGSGRNRRPDKRWIRECNRISEHYGREDGGSKRSEVRPAHSQMYDT
jgi:hypothetical protein